MKLFGGEGMAKEPSLGEDVLVAAGEIAGLLGGFDALDDNLQVECLGHGENLRQNRNGHRIGADGFGKGAVDLDGVDGQILKISEAGVAGAKVVDVDAMSVAAQLQDRVHGQLLARGSAFGNLDAIKI